MRPCFLPKGAQQLHFAIGKIVLRAGDHDGFELGWDNADFEKVQFLKLDVLILDEGF